MSEPIQLHDTKPVPEVVHCLVELLEKARSGQIRSIAYCADLIGNQTISGVQGEAHRANAADWNWALDTIKYELLSYAHSGGEDLDES